jgi:hypothetical protein
MSSPLINSLMLLANIELYLEIQELRALGFSDDEITGWLEMYAEECLKRWKHEHLRS